MAVYYYCVSCWTEYGRENREEKSQEHVDVPVAFRQLESLARCHGNHRKAGNGRKWICVPPEQDRCWGARS